MNPKVRSTLADDLAQGRACSICGQEALQVVHLDAYPDYVNCGNCGSAFVVEDGGERVMYGKIPAQYPETRHFALQQWVWPEAIDRKAAPERPSGPPSLISPPPPPPPAEPTPPAEPEAPPAEETPVEESVETLRSELQPADEAAVTELSVEDGSDAEAATLVEPASDEADELAQSESPTWPPPAIGAGEPEPPDSSSWPPPAEESETGEGLEDQQTPDEEPSPSEPAGVPGDLLDSSEQPPSTEDVIGEEAPTAAWESDLGAAAPFGDEPEPSEVQASLGDEEDLLDDLWGDEPYPTSEVSTAQLPEPPAWASEMEPEHDEPSPDDEAEAPDSDGEEAPPAESDQDTANRLHTWGAPVHDEPGPPEPSTEDQAQAPEFPWDAPSDDMEQEPPPAVAPFEDSRWPDEDFGLPDEAADEPTEPEPLEEPASEPPGPPAVEIASGEAPLVVPVEDAGEQDEMPSDVTPDEGQDQAADEPAGPEPDDGVMEGMAQTYWGGVDGPPPPKEELSAEELQKAEPVHHEPPPGNRYRVVVKGASVRYPEQICSHCLYSPAPARLPILASISRSGVGDRQIETLRVPVCTDCKQRASARSEEQRTAQLQAHLIGVLVALVLIVCGLGFGFINLRENLVPALVGLIVMAGLGYVVPAVPLLLRASRLPKPPDSEYVQSTLRVPGDTEGTETAFEWRNQDYARRFLLANTKIAVSDVTRVREEGT